MAFTSLHAKAVVALTSVVMFIGTITDQTTMSADVLMLPVVRHGRCY